MKIIDLGNEITQANLVSPGAIPSSGPLGSSLDLQGYQGKVRITLNIGTVTGTSPTLDIKVQDSADNATFADVSPAVAFAQKVSGSANTNDSIVVDTRAVRRYIKLYGTVGGTTPSFTVSALAIGQKQTI